MAWIKISLVNNFIEKVLDLLKEDSLSPKFDISSFVATVKSIQELQATVEKKWIEKINNEENDKKREPLIKEAKECFRTQLRNECLKMMLAVSGMSNAIINPDTNGEQESKAKLIYWRLLDIVFKLDCIDGLRGDTTSAKSGKDFLNLSELGTDTRLENKSTLITTSFFTFDASNKSPTQDRDWLSVLEAVERDITSLNNDHKYKKLGDKISE